jgi:eukaryotic-like serine/threonine-protein kinase
MALAPGTKLGPYEIVAPIGAGGMGEVYRARDSRLGREVAVKILPQAFALDPERLRRFTAEAQAVAALNHPNILAIHDVGTLDGSQYIVMEFLNGESLRERLTTGALSIRKATDYAEQIAKGLAAAHDKGIVHRDLKPDNIFVTREGHVKILDFGLAKLTSTEAAKDPAETMTRTSATQPGVVLGTVGYMSPEQVRGQVADQRSDIFSFGAIFYEMLTGKRAFTGDSSVEVMSAILKEEPPPLTEAVRAIPPALDRIVHHCLEKNPAERFQSARDVAFNIASLSDVSSTGGTSSTTTAAAAAAQATQAAQAQQVSIRQKRLLALVSAAFLLFAAGTLWFLWHQRTQKPVVTFDRVTFGEGSVGSARFTADGQTIIFDASWDGGVTRLYQWRADAPQAQPMPGMDNVRVVGISKSNEMALLLRVGALDRVPVTLARAPISGGAPREILESVRDATWSPDEQLAVVHVVNGRDRLEFPIGKVLYETGGWLSNPRFSPDGRTIAFLDHTVFPDAAGTVSVVDLNGKREVLTPFWDDTRGLAWSGNQIVYGGANANWDALRAVDLAKHDRLLLELPSLVEVKDVAPDGRVLIDSRNNRLTILGRGPGATRERNLSWLDISILADISRDGKQILLAEEDTPEQTGEQVCCVGIRDMDGSPVTRLGEGVGGRFSADGKWVTTLTLAKPPKISVIPLAAGEGKQVPLPGIERLDGDNVGFFPDGKRLWLNAADTTGSTRAFAVGIAGGTPTPITPEGVLADGISDDGETVVGTDPQHGVTLYPIAGGPARTIPGTNGFEHFVQWTNDPHSMYIRDLELPTNVYQVNIATGQRTPVLKLIPAEPAGVVTIFVVAMTRDGKSYAYTFRRSLSQLLIVRGVK